MQCSPVSASGEIPDPSRIRRWRHLGVAFPPWGHRLGARHALGGICLLPSRWTFGSYPCGIGQWSRWPRRSFLDFWGGLGLRCSSTKGSAHRCRRPSLGYPTPFVYTWSRQRIVLRLRRRHTDVGAHTRLSDALRLCQVHPLVCSCCGALVSATCPPTSWGGSGLRCLSTSGLAHRRPVLAIQRPLTTQSRLFNALVSVGFIANPPPLVFSLLLLVVFFCVLFFFSSPVSLCDFSICCKNLARHATFE